MRNITIFAIGGALLLEAGISHASAADDAKRLAKKVCSPCHGPAGVSLVLNYPNLAGQKKKYMIQQLDAFKDGSRKHKLMSPVAERLTAKEIKHVAKYYSKLDPDPADPTSAPD